MRVRHPESEHRQIPRLREKAERFNGKDHFIKPFSYGHNNEVSVRSLLPQETFLAVEAKITVFHAEELRAVAPPSGRNTPRK